MTVSQSQTLLVELSDVSVTHTRTSSIFRRVAPVQAVAGVNLRVNAGETVALVGESGCGKSTLANAIVGVVKPSGGRIRICGTDITHANADELRKVRKSVQMVFQDPYSSLNPRRRIGSSIAEPALNYGLVEKRDVAAHIERLLDLVGLDPSVAPRYPDQLSGGQLQRVCIARALSISPRLLICDEATSSLDVSVQAQILELLRRIQSDIGLALLVITHNLAVVRQLCDRTAVMYLGKIVEEGPTTDVFVKSQHPYTKCLLRSGLDLEDANLKGSISQVIQGEMPSPSTPPPGCRFHTRCELATENCGREEPPLRLTAAASERKVACWHSEQVADWEPGEDAGS